MTGGQKLITRERRQRVHESIEAEGVASVRDLAQRFGVAALTVSRDLQSLEREGLVRRVRGGAISVRGAGYEPPYSARQGHLQDEKRRIAHAAASLVSDGDSVILDVGTTSLEVARALKGRRNLTVIVTNLHCALELASQPAIQVIVIGGKLRISELSMVGQLAESMLRQFQVDKVFIGVGGITFDRGLTESNIDEAGVKRTMLDCARKRIVLADHTKFGKVMLSTVSPLAMIDTVVTDTGIDDEIVARFRDSGIEVILA